MSVSRAKSMSKANLRLDALHKRVIDVDLGVWRNMNVGGVTGPEVDIMISTLHAVFDLKDDVKESNATLYGPGSINIPKTNTTIGARIILTMGSDEVYTLKVASGKIKGNENFHARKGEAFILPYGYPTVFDIEVEDNNHVLAPRPGWRSQRVPKSKNRYTLVVDFTVNAAKLSSIITAESKALAEKSGTTSEEIELRARKLLLS